MYRSLRSIVILAFGGWLSGCGGGSSDPPDSRSSQASIRPNTESCATECRSILALATGRRSAVSAEPAFAQRRFKGGQPERRNWESGGVFSLQGSRYKLILHMEGPDEFFDLSTDPEEVTNLSGSGMVEEDRLRRQLLALKADFERDGERVEKGEIDPRVVEELEALGYL